MLKVVNAWLIEYDEALNPVPSALKSFEIADYNASVLLTLRPDVVFQTGKPMTVDDLVYGLERAVDPDRGFNLFAAASTLIDFVEVVDDRSVRSSSSSPRPPRSSPTCRPTCQ